MNISVTRSSNGKSFTLSLNGEERTYRDDKEGKRQAILAGLNTVETVTVGQAVYLLSHAALQIVATVLYPNGIQTEAAYKLVCNVTEKACAHIGYGAEIELGPPAVPFSARGAYRKQYPPVDEQMIWDELELAGTSNTHSRQEVACTILWNKAGLDVYGRHWSQLTPAEQSLIQVQVDEIARQAGWHKDDSTTTGTYTKSLPIDDVDDTLVYLEMVGAKQSVKANWAALVGGGKVHWLGRKRIQLDGMKSHVKIQSTLPCGWANHILIHKQASLKEMNPEQPFYLLDDGTQPAQSPSKGPIPPLSYPMLNKCLALPLLESWSEYLWANGRERKLISLLDEGEGQGYVAWRVLPAPTAWQELVQFALQNNHICF